MGPPTACDSTTTLMTFVGKVEQVCALQGMSLIHGFCSITLSSVSISLGNAMVYIYSQQKFILGVSKI